MRWAASRIAATPLRAAGQPDIPGSRTAGHRREYARHVSFRPAPDTAPINAATSHIGAPGTATNTLAAAGTRRRRTYRPKKLATSRIGMRRAPPRTNTTASHISRRRAPPRTRSPRPVAAVTEPITRVRPSRPKSAVAGNRPERSRHVPSQRSPNTAPNQVAMSQSGHD
jgi:hypothetical protein